MYCDIACLPSTAKIPPPSNATLVGIVLSSSGKLSRTVNVAKSRNK